LAPTKTCLSCGRSLEHSGRGRPALYCSDACRVRAHRARTRDRVNVASREVAEALAEIDLLRDKSGRAAFTCLIEEALGRPVQVGSDDIPKVSLYNLVRECRELPGGVEALLSAVDFLADGTRPAALVRRLLHRASADEDHNLAMALAGLRHPAIPRIYSAVGRAVVPAIRPLDAREAFTALLEVKSDDDVVPPSVAFAALLSREMQRSAVTADRSLEMWRIEQLSGWLDSHVDGLRAAGNEVAAEYIEQLRDYKEQTPQAFGDSIYLIVQLEPVDDPSADDQLIKLSHWRQLHPVEWRPERGADRIVPVQQVPAAVRDLIGEAEMGWAYLCDEPLVLEFVLPSSMMHLAPDQWTRDPPDDPYPVPLGCEYDVVVRSLERMYTRTMQRAWRHRWQALAGAEGGAPRPRIERPAGLDRLRGRLVNDSALAACVLSSPPDQDPGRTELRMALRAGVPVVVWHRGDASPDELLGALGHVLEETDIRRLPTVLRQKRALTLLDDDRDRTIFSSITLLYDDPDHFVVDPQLLPMESSRVTDRDPADPSEPSDLSRSTAFSRDPKSVSRASE
jgi:vWA-MoxR associated protein C-terminal domain/Effector-associated domain 2/vWA-MoxR associated protein middle region 0